MKERVFKATSITVEQLIQSLGEDHPMCQGVKNLKGRTVTVDKEKFEEAVAEVSLKGPAIKEETEDA